MSRIRINELRVKGIRKDYFITFKTALNIISGEMSTGKTSILELIDYCFGNNECPTYPELERNGTTALLEIEIDREAFTIERQLFSTRQKQNIHFCNIADLPSPHKTMEVNSYQKIGEESVGSFLLSKIGLKDIPLREALARDESGIDTLSFRDILWLCYLRRTRVAGNDLLFESNRLKENKLIQVVDVLFDLHSDRSAVLGAELKSLLAEISDKQKTERVLSDVASSQGISTLDQLESEKGRLFEDIENKKSLLEKIDAKISGSSEIAKGLQDEVLKIRKSLQEIRTEKRGHEKTLQRLIPLRSQYFEDISKLHLINQAKTIMDPLSLVICPVCLSPFRLKTEEKERCPLCGCKLEQKEEIPINVNREIRTIERKLDELSTYVKETQEVVKQNAIADEELSQKLAISSKKLDDTLRSFVSPYLTEREGLVSAITTDQNGLKHIDDSVKLRNQIQEVTEQILALQARQKEIQRILEEERKKSLNRTELINALSAIFLKHLQMVKFPKLTNAYIDERLVPYVRGLRYDQLSSEGAINLSSICWITSIYIEAMRSSLHHPGFLMLDGVQSGIGLGSNVDNEFRDQSIVDGLYVLLKEISEFDDDCQIIIVDNHPPSYIKKPDVRVYFSGDAKRPPYGFIDDETS